MRVSVSIAITCLFTTVSSAQTPIFTQRHTVPDVRLRRDGRCGGQPYAAKTNTTLTVYDNRHIVYERWTTTRCPAENAPPANAHTDDMEGAKQRVSGTVSSQTFAEFRQLLERDDVRQLTSFMNAGPGEGDFAILIDRGNATQTIDVVSLLPTHRELVDRPALLNVICASARLVTSVARSVASPRWCAVPDR